GRPPRCAPRECGARGPAARWRERVGSPRGNWDRRRRSAAPRPCQRGAPSLAPGEQSPPGPPLLARFARPRAWRARRMVLRCIPLCLCRREFVYGVDQGSYVIDGGLGQDAVAQVEDVARASGGLAEDGGGAGSDLGHGGEEGGGVEVPLHRDLVPEA